MTTRWGDNGTVRVTRAVGVAHAEAFQLMLYVAVDAPETMIWFWNSRDGVTPFCTWVDGKEYRHAIHGYPTEYTAVLPEAATHVWVDFTPEYWREMLRKRWESATAAPKSEFHDPEEFVKRWPTAESFSAVQEFEHGSPMYVTREQFLANTNSWHGRVVDEKPVAA